MERSSSSTGNEVSNYGFKESWADASGLIFLRARFYLPSMGRFLTPDAWQGYYDRPQS